MYITAGIAQAVLDLNFTVSENIGERYVNACVELSMLPSGGLECDTTLYLEAQSDTACECYNNITFKQYNNCCFFFSC